MNGSRPGEICLRVHSLCHSESAYPAAETFTNGESMLRESSNPAIAVFLSKFTAVATEHMDWHSVKIKLVASAYVAPNFPPPEYITSVRSLVFHNGSILLMRNRDGARILPGGRLEPGETLLDALRREIREEAGVRIRDIHRLGFVHLRHRTPKPPQYAYPYPDFFWLVFRAHAHGKRVRPQEPDDNQISAEFVPLAQLGSLNLRPLDRAYLAAATQGLSENRGSD